MYTHNIIEKSCQGEDQSSQRFLDNAVLSLLTLISMEYVHVHVYLVWHTTQLFLHVHVFPIPEVINRLTHYYSYVHTLCYQS